jgi:hypothetical protein
LPSKPLNRDGFFTSELLENYLAIASLAWITERTSGQTNIISKIAEQLATEGKWLVAILALSAIVSMCFSKKEKVPE